MDRANIVHGNFLRRVAANELPTGVAPKSGLDPYTAVEIYRAQLTSRALDITSRRMQKEGQGFYTIGSSGHEGMAAVARALRPNDIAFLHYRDAAFQLARADQVTGQTMTWDMLLSFACSLDDPISGGVIRFWVPKTCLSRHRLPRLPVTCQRRLGLLIRLAQHVGTHLNTASCPKTASRFAHLVTRRPITQPRRGPLMQRVGHQFNRHLCHFCLFVKITESGFPRKHPMAGSPHR